MSVNDRSISGVMSDLISKVREVPQMELCDITTKDWIGSSRFYTLFEQRSLRPMDGMISELPSILSQIVLTQRLGYFG